MEELGEKVKFSFWEKYDENHTVIRFATSWATKMEDIDALIDILYGGNCPRKNVWHKQLRIFYKKLLVEILTPFWKHIIIKTGSK